MESFPNNDQADVQLAVYSRKAGYEYGWDWGPRLITCGLWKPVQLKAWNTAKIDALNVIQNSVTREVAELTAVFEINASTATNAVLNLALDGDRMSSSAIALASGFNKIPVNFKIKKPDLWWSNGLGTHYLYSIQGQLMIGGSVADESTVKTGIRSLRVVRTNDAAGQSFYVELNGLPVFMKGASYIPQDNFANRITADRYETMVKSAADANMNMLRVWGGGFYPDDKFYEACDQFGVLVWQDMMFACGMFPDSEAFVQSVTNEITDNIIRLRNHPCIALYNGNNENEISWHSWGWKGEYSEPVQRDYETSMSNLFRVAIPAAIGKTDNTRYYHPTSPSVGYLEKPVAEGDMHYWGVWHGKEPFSEYNDLKHIARFMSEYGFQSYPDFSTILKFSTSEDWDIHTLTMLAHQRCMADGRKDVEYGNRLIQHYMDNDYRRAKDFRSFIYLSQVCQADGVKIAAEAHRRHMTDQFCMGSLYWQLDDCWPAASWSSIDYYGNWKALHYYAAKFFNPTILSAIEENGEYRIYGISDRTNAENAQLGIKIIGLRGEIIKEDKRDVVLGPNTSAVIYSTDVTNFFAGIDKKSAFVWLTLSRGNKEFYSDLKSILPLKEVHLLKPKISVKMKPGDVNWQMELTTDVVAKNVYVTLVDKTGKPMAANFTDNYFDLVPGEVKKIQLREHSKPDGKVEKVEVISLVDTYD